jgi:hypothetical protein
MISLPLGSGVYFVVGHGGDKNTQITHGSSLFHESDRTSLEEQQQTIDRILPPLEVIHSIDLHVESTRLFSANLVLTVIKKPILTPTVIKLVKLGLERVSDDYGLSLSGNVSDNVHTRIDAIARN